MLTTTTRARLVDLIADALHADLGDLARPRAECQRIAANAVTLARRDSRTLAAELEATSPDARGCGPLELLPYNGLILYDDERELLEWADGTDPAAGRIVDTHDRDVTRGDVITGALRSLSRLRARRLEELGRPGA